MNILKNLILKKGGRILLFIIDGLGGVPEEPEGKTELESARTPHLDELARKGVLGMVDAVAPGISPGSGPAHLALFGYDPVEYQIGRGVLEAFGVGVDLTPLDIAVRANFATKSQDGVIVDRRAGRIETQESRKLVQRIQKEIKKIDGVEIKLFPGKEHRFVVIFKGENLSDAISDTDPQKEGFKPLSPVSKKPEADKTLKVVEKFLFDVDEILKSEEKANTILLRGFSRVPEWERFPERFNLRALGLAYYPMYSGLAKLVGMDTINTRSFEESIKALKEKHKEYDFVFLHFKETDKAGEDGDFEKKIKEIERVDGFIPEILSADFDCIAITGDHSTPSKLKSHSWHPSPLLLYSEVAGCDSCKTFNEKEALKGYIGHIQATYLMSLLMANARRFQKFGA